jgi:hypothetical protein
MNWLVWYIVGFTSGFFLMWWLAMIQLRGIKIELGLMRWGKQQNIVGMKKESVMGKFPIDFKEQYLNLEDKNDG